MHGNKPSKKKVAYPISEKLNEYLVKYNRAVHLPVQYEDLMRYDATLPVQDPDGIDTNWETCIYAPYEFDEIERALCEIYALLKTDGDISVIEHLSVDRVDFCMFGNTHPFRVRIINKLNDNFDHFYVKRIDASRVYGLELEELLSPNRFDYLVDRHTLVEEHIAGIPGDDFFAQYPLKDKFQEIRVAKEFIKFNERCFLRLLGDMRAYNFIIDITPDIDGAQYRIRAIDFDQQSYEGRKNFYLPQYFKENNDIIALGLKHLTPETVKQYQFEERSLIARRIKNSRARLSALIRAISKDKISSDKKVAQLKKELGKHHQSDIFEACETMGDIVFSNIKLALQKEFRQSIEDLK